MWKRHGGSRVSHVPLQKKLTWKNEAGTSGWSVPISQSQTTVFVGQWMEWDLLPPCCIRRREEKGKKEEVLHLFRCYTHTDTHTHTPGQSRVNPERQEEEKNGHRRRAKGQNSAGGERNERSSRTNLRGETDLTETEHTPKPHDTLEKN